jgi:hypothetical protein
MLMPSSLRIEGYVASFTAVRRIDEACLVKHANDL